MQMMEQAFDYLDAPVMRVTARCADAICCNLEKLALPQADDIAAAAVRPVTALKEADMSVSVLMPALSPTMTEGTCTLACQRETASRQVTS